ncbi:cytochrome c maturation protein CcmE [Caldichromatium japonicum]|uniref:Cytochrome c-type biogenesis protein CcmE n=1 Tax=Caldichromatium japonicum TaxID=2699430 RepID=A0A6G7VF11_9GAMM|nr:cytochrome c maturation protein CcmE [Caldichromatium japonicum]QIK38465.1 cytochrome c maturation protein CcmE [Caldichromatium japonicum]
MKARHKRMILIALALGLIVAASTLAITALKSNVSYFFSPSQVIAGEAPRDHVFRLGGLVQLGTLKRQGDGLLVEFAVTDNRATVKVAYSGILPDLFKEGSGMVAKGRLGADGVFQAEEVLAKHDEEYMPPEVAKTLQAAHTEGVMQTTGNPTAEASSR